MVPGHDNRLGFGGACLPKDSTAIIKYAESNDTNLNLLMKAVEINNKIRSAYKERTNREEDQNITYISKNDL